MWQTEYNFWFSPSSPYFPRFLRNLTAKKFIWPTISKRIDSSQFAYISRPGSGLTSAPVLTYHKIVEFHDSGAVRLLSVDLSKALDKLLHSHVVSACVDVLLPPFVVNLVTSFLSSRVQRVFMDGHVSTWSTVLNGASHGSILGPILLCLATDGLSHVYNNSTVIKYADDVSILHFVRHSSQDHLQLEWDQLVSWSECVNLPLNAMKCRVIDCK